MVRGKVMEVIQIQHHIIGELVESMFKLSQIVVLTTD